MARNETIDRLITSQIVQYAPSANSLAPCTFPLFLASSFPAPPSSSTISTFLSSPSSSPFPSSTSSSPHSCLLYQARNSLGSLAPWHLGSPGSVIPTPPAFPSEMIQFRTAWPSAPPCYHNRRAAQPKPVGLLKTNTALTPAVLDCGVSVGRRSPGSSPLTAGPANPQLAQLPTTLLLFFSPRLNRPRY